MCSPQASKGTPTASRSMVPKLRTILGVSVVIVILTAYWRYGHLVTTESMRKNNNMLRAVAASYPVGAPLLFVAGMTGLVSLSLPGASGCCFLAGLLFPAPLACLLTWFGFSFGSALCYVLVQNVCGDYVQGLIRDTPKMGGYFVRFREYLQESEVIPMLVVRYLLFIPHWFTNASAALLDVNLCTFLWTTALASLPGTLLYTFAGTTLASIFAEQERAVAAGMTAVDTPSTLQLLVLVIQSQSSRNKALIGASASLFLLVPLAAYWYSNKTAKRKSKTSPKRTTYLSKDVPSLDCSNPSPFKIRSRGAPHNL